MLFIEHKYLYTLISFFSGNMNEKNLFMEKAQKFDKIKEIGNKKRLLSAEIRKLSQELLQILK